MAIESMEKYNTDSAFESFGHKNEEKSKAAAEGDLESGEGFGVTFQVGATGNLGGQETPALKHAGAAWRLVPNHRASFKIGSFSRDRSTFTANLGLNAMPALQDSLGDLGAIGILMLNISKLRGLGRCWVWSALTYKWLPFISLENSS